MNLTTERHEGGVIIITLGSLFDGSGGFPLAGVLNGITPLWASEIEPYPIRVTKTRFPDMKHLGSVLDINGAEIEPVDIITFGSPCQDLSVAGKQKGIHEGERSNLFFEAIRIAKEMREHDRATGRSDVDLRPRFLVWENVPGAFSSNQGEDFRAVLEALGGIAEDGLSIPRPPKGKWNHAGCVVGDGWSVAWRVYDAQYWGVPQRRKRIYLVADFASERAGEILFERESVRGHSAEGGEAREGTADDAQGSTGGSGCHVGLIDSIGGGAESGKITDLANTLKACHYKSPPVACVAAGFKAGQSMAGGIGWQEERAATLSAQCSGVEPTICYDITGASSNSMKSPTPDSCFKERTVSRTLDTFAGTPDCNQGGVAIVHALDCRNLRGQPELSGTLQAKPNGGQSLNYQNPVVYDARGNGGGITVPTLTGDHQNRVTDYTSVAVYDTTQITSPLNYSKPQPGDPFHPLAANQHPPLCVGNGQLHQMSMAEQCNTLDCMHDQQAVLMQAEYPRKYIVRRLTPLECCRLQGFPDWWEDGVEGSDSARYKMWGNGIALPCAVDVLRRTKNEIKEEQPCTTTRPM